MYQMWNRARGVAKGLTDKKERPEKLRIGVPSGYGVPVSTETRDGFSKGIVRLQEQLKFKDSVHFVNIWLHPCQLQITIIHSDVSDFTQENAPSHAADIFDFMQIHNDIEVLSLEHLVYFGIQFLRGRRVQIPLDFDDRNVTVRLYLVRNKRGRVQDSPQSFLMRIKPGSSS